MKEKLENCVILLGKDYFLCVFRKAGARIFLDEACHLRACVPLVLVHSKFESLSV